MLANCRDVRIPRDSELKMANKKTTTKSPTKTEIRNAIAEKTGLTKKDVSSVFDALEEVISKSLRKSGPKVFSIPGLVKFKVVRKPATKARKGINPFTKEEMMFKAKPARNVVKALALKGLKDLAA